MLLQSPNQIAIEAKAVNTLSMLCDGDARIALNSLQMALDYKIATTGHQMALDAKMSTNCHNSNAKNMVTEKDINDGLQRLHCIQYDRTGKYLYVYNMTEQVNTSLFTM